MVTVYIHIGMMKTGSTYLQEFFAQNQEAMEKQGFCYPLMDMELPRKYKYRNAHFLIYRSPLEGEEGKKEEEYYWKKGFEILADCAKKYDKIIISDEILWYRQKKKGLWDAVKQEMEKIGCDFKVIVYLRRQDLFVQSYWNQCVKGEPRTDISFERYIADNEYQFCALDYDRQLSKMASWMGKDRMIVRVFEKGQFEGENHTLLSDFVKYVGLELTEEFITDVSFSNEAISDNYIEIKRLINSIPEYHRTDNFMRAVVSEAYEKSLSENPKGESTSMFSYEEQKRFLEQYSEGNRKAAKEFLNREDGVLFQEQIVDRSKWQVDEQMIWRDLVYTFSIAQIKQHMENVQLKEQLRVLKTENRELGQRLNKLERQMNKISEFFVVKLLKKFR